MVSEAEIVQPRGGSLALLCPLLAAELGVVSAIRGESFWAFERAKRWLG